MAQEIFRTIKGAIMSLKTLITSLKTQLENYAGLSYASKTAYVAKNPIALMEKNRYPFFNVLPEGTVTEKVDNISFTEMERNIHTVVIQLATMSLKEDVCVMGDNNTTGMLDFIDDIWSGIKSDRTIGGSVNGILPGSTVNIDILELGDEDRVFVAQAELRIEFYKDGPVTI